MPDHAVARRGEVLFGSGERVVEAHQAEGVRRADRTRSRPRAGSSAPGTRFTGKASRDRRRAAIGSPAAPGRRTSRRGPAASAVGQVEVFGRAVARRGRAADRRHPRRAAAQLGGLRASARARSRGSRPPHGEGDAAGPSERPATCARLDQGDDSSERKPAEQRLRLRQSAPIWAPSAATSGKVCSARSRSTNESRSSRP